MSTTLVQRFRCAFCRQVLMEPGLALVIPKGSKVCTTYSTLGGSSEVLVHCTVTTPTEEITYAHFTHDCGELIHD